MRAPLEKHLSGRLLHKPAPRPPAITSHDLAPAAPLLSRVLTAHRPVSSQPSSRVQYHTAIHQLDLSQKIRSHSPIQMRTHLVDSRSWQRAVCRSMSWHCLPGMLDLSSTHLGLQAALDAAEAVLECGRKPISAMDGGGTKCLTQRCKNACPRIELCGLACWRALRARTTYRRLTRR